MRFRYYFVVQDAQGNVISNAAVSVYLAGTTTPAIVYATRTSQQGESSAPQLYSRENGSVVFWVDSNDYSYGQLFDIVVQKDTFSLSLSDVQIIVWDAVNAVNATNASNSAKLGGYDGSYYLNRANHTGTQSPSTISPQGSGSGLNADKVDGFDASLTPGPNVIVPLNASGILDLSAAYVKSNVYTFRRIDLTNATSDYNLQVGEEAYISFSNVTSVPLHIATQSGTYYEMDIVMLNNVGNQSQSGAGIMLNPNNTTYSSSFYFRQYSVVDSSSGVAEDTHSAFKIGENYSVSRVYISNYTTAKTTKTFCVFWGDWNTALEVIVSAWKDTSTAWTSLGTVIFPNSSSGYILVRRLA